MNQATAFALEASREAWSDAGLLREEHVRIGLALGTAVGGVEASFEGRQGRIRRIDRRSCPATAVAEALELTGPVCTMPVACAAGNVAIVQAFLQIQHHHAEIMLAGGTDAATEVPFAGFSSLNVLTGDCIRPFDRQRSGFLIGEGAGILVLESLEGARARGARAYGELLGFGLSADAHHIVHPHPEARGVIAAMEAALRMADRTPAEVDYVNAHGTATVANDKCECLAMRTVFGEQRRIVTSSFKSVLGHTMGAAGAIETIGCLLALRHQCIPPTWNFQTADPECDVDCVPNRPRPSALRVIVKNSSGFGGSNCSLVLGA